MKLRNLRSGEIVKVVGFDQSYDEIKMRFVNENNEGRLYVTDSLITFNSEWEEYQEYTGYWYIGCDGSVSQNCEDSTQTHTNNHKLIGNYFNTREEAEKAVEKLKAWKRLKDNGFKFEGTNNRKKTTGYLGKSFNSQDECEQAMKDLDLLFGGEE